MSHKKIGIITFYYHNYNYGGILQAYALQTYLENHNCDAKQISFDPFGHVNQASTKLPLINRIVCNLKNYGFFSTCKIYLNTVKEKTSTYFNKNKIKTTNVFIDKRKNIIDKFKEQIPHTNNVYNELTIHNCEKFSSYISGSDQI